MYEDNFSFKFPDLDLNLKDINLDKANDDTIKKINEYLDNDILEQDLLIKKLDEFEKLLDLRRS